MFEPCKPPFSFIFDFVNNYCKGSKSNKKPMRRICGLMRKMGATHFLVEPKDAPLEILDEVQAIEKRFRSEGSEATFELNRFSFFRFPTKVPESIEDVADAHLLSYVDLLTVSVDSNPVLTYVIGSVICLPNKMFRKGAEKKGSQQELEFCIGVQNYYVHIQKDFKVTICNKEFKIKGTYYCQQNGITNVCAHACLIMMLKNHLGGDCTISSEEINRKLGKKHEKGSHGPIINISEVEKILKGYGLAVNDIDCLDSNWHVQKYEHFLHSYIESCPAILIIQTRQEDSQRDESGQTERIHNVAVIGHTFDSDAWGPEAKPTYTKNKLPYLPASRWIGDFIVHDDNYGPYLTLETSLIGTGRLSVEQLKEKKKAKDLSFFASFILPFVPKEVKMLAPQAEEFASDVVEKFLEMEDGDHPYYALIKQEQNRVIRSILLKKEEYIRHLTELRDRYGISCGSDEIRKVGEWLPDFMWLCECSTPEIFTINRAKVADIIVDAKREIVQGLSYLVPSYAVCVVRFPKKIWLLRRGSSNIEKIDSNVNNAVPLFTLPDNALVNAW